MCEDNNVLFLDLRLRSVGVVYVFLNRHPRGVSVGVMALALAEAVP